ncbi:TnsA-like heteromeric transposase endonuclease subunit [Dactylosporangium sp. NPDC000244]|uniref:TnsA-like heteromeric transposase endonuclease subunit n=1 Tax=Dactylosporangium sp. NPDC000244 TaxID=3154365 RepID=UPI003329BBA9
MGQPALALSRAAPAEDFEMRFVDRDGVERRDLLRACWMETFEVAPPVRKFNSYLGQRSFDGLWWSATTSDHVGYESWLERDHVMLLDFDPDVTGLASQPFQIGWQQGGRLRWHTPDYFVRMVDGTGVVVDVRPDDRIDPEDAEAFEATARACDSVGWRFRRVGEIDAVFAANLRWLAGYRHPRCLHQGRAADLLRVFSRPAGLMEGARRVGDPIAVLPTLFHLLWRQALSTDLAVSALSAASVVQAGGEEQ